MPWPQDREYYAHTGNRYENPDDYSITTSAKKDELKRKFRFNQQFMPIQGERLDTWITRTYRLVQELEEFSTQKHVFGKNGAWFTHWSQSSCFMCDQATACRFMIIALTALSDILKLNEFEWTQKDGLWIIQSINISK